MSTTASRIREANATVLANGDTVAIPEFFASDYLAHSGGRDMTGGHDAVRAIVERWRNAFHNLSVDVEILVEGTDRVAWQRTLHATHAGAYAGFPPTGLSVVWRDMVVSRFKDGLIAEEWVVSDLAEQLLRARKR